MGDDGGGFEGTSYSMDDYSNAYSGGNNDAHYSNSYSGGSNEAHYNNSYSGGNHDTVDHNSRNVSTDIDPPELSANKGHDTKDRPLNIGSFDNSADNQEEDWPENDKNHSPKAEEPLINEDDIITEYSPESKEKMNGDGFLNPMFGAGGDDFDNDRSADNNGCTADDCCYYTVVCCDCTIL